MKVMIEKIRAYIPYNDKEAADKEVILKLLQGPDDVYKRDNKIAHLTASAWVLNKNHDKILLAFHNIYKSWSWLGGHADGEKDLLAVAIREVQEESGISSIRALSDEIFSLEVLTVAGHYKKGKYVNSHLHLNLTYLLEADESEDLKIKEDENSNVGWFPIADAPEMSDETWMVENIYKKLNEKALRFLEEDECQED